MVLYLCVLIVFSLHRESLKLILVDEPLPEVVLSHPRHDVTEVTSSSYDLSLFSSKVGSPLEENTGSPSVSVGELWPEIDLLDGVVRGGHPRFQHGGHLGIKCHVHAWTPKDQESRMG
jgi:hypothetical protein